jgi:hypothetical protein
MPRMVSSAMIRGCISVFATLALALAAAPIQGATPVGVLKVATEEAACNSVKARVATVEHFDVSVIAFCDFIVKEEQPAGFYVLALHSRRDCDGICSTNMGWFAIEKATGRVFEWDVADCQLGRVI